MGPLAGQLEARGAGLIIATGCDGPDEVGIMDLETPDRSCVATGLIGTTAAAVAAVLAAVLAELFAAVVSAPSLLTSNEIYEGNRCMLLLTLLIIPSI
jgi:hypothetical protein